METTVLSMSLLLALTRAVSIEAVVDRVEDAPSPDETVLVLELPDYPSINLPGSMCPECRDGDVVVLSVKTEGTKLIFTVERNERLTRERQTGVGK